MGLTAYTMGDIDTATARLLESIEVNPGGDQTSAWAHLGLIAQERHDLAAARRPSSSIRAWWITRPITAAGWRVAARWLSPIA